jgi:phosphatidate cytidylyltransferase
MLRQRIITAVLMLAVLLPALFHASPWPFAVLTVLLLAAAAWEWGSLNGLSPVAAWSMGAACAAICLMSWWSGLLQHDLQAGWYLAGLGWVLGGSRLLAGGVPVWQQRSRGLRCLLGLLCLWAAWLAVVQSRQIGLNFLLSTLTLVWMADVAAYFAGKAWGGRFIHRKLAPGISPGKSWEGALGGALGVLILGGIWSQVELLGGEIPLAERSLHGQLLAQHGVWVWLIASLFLSAMSVVGDLVESLLKRSAGAKDSSGLLPGHGGVLDRVDALLPVLPLAMMLSNFSRYSP